MFSRALHGRAQRTSPLREKAKPEATATATEISNFRFEISDQGNSNGEARFKNTAG